MEHPNIFFVEVVLIPGNSLLVCASKKILYNISSPCSTKGKEKGYKKTSAMSPALQIVLT